MNATFVIMRNSRVLFSCLLADTSFIRFPRRTVVQHQRAGDFWITFVTFEINRLWGILDRHEDEETGT